MTGPQLPPGLKPDGHSTGCDQPDCPQCSRRRDLAYMDGVVAAADLVGRSGGRHFEIGWLWDDETPPPRWPPGVPVTLAAMGWYAVATYKGAKLRGEGNGPVQAAEQLARRILAGAKCTGCDRRVHLDDGCDPPVGSCVWSRKGKHWVGCAGKYGGGKTAGNRAQRRRR